MTEHDFCVWLDGFLADETDPNTQAKILTIRVKLKTVAAPPPYIPGKYYPAPILPLVAPLYAPTWTVGDLPFNPYEVTAECHRFGEDNP